MDGNLNTMWRSTNIFEPWLSLYLNGIPSPACRVDIAWADGNTRQYQFDVYVTDDNQITRKVLQDIISTGTSTGFESYPFDHNDHKNKTSWYNIDHSANIENKVFSNA